MLSRLKRMPRHISALKEHSTVKKVANVAKVERDLALRKTVVSGFPYIMFIDTCNSCNLRCPLCPSSDNTFKQPRGVMSFDTYRTVFDKFSEYAFEVNLHNWGEPLLNRDIFKIIEYSKKNNVGTNLSSNLASVSLDQIDEVIDSGLEYLVVSIDGMDADTYSKYRVKGNFDLVINNLNRLVEQKKKHKKRSPIIEWQFLVMKHNEHQIEEAKRLADKIGVDLIRFTPVGLPFEKLSDKEMAKDWMPENKNYWDLNPELYREKQYFFDKACHYLYRSISINPSGTVSPCCVIYDSKYDVGDLSVENLRSFWNNDYYQQARSLFSSKQSIDNNAIIPCHSCQLFRKKSKERVS